MTQPPPELDDDALADLIADRLVELASQPGILRLAVLQMAGLIPQEPLEQGTIAQHLGCTRRRVQQIQQTALAKLALNSLARDLRQSL
jgi:DNA-directed RNA polymerase sigma subunit (sigma70/sigma32)